MIRYRTWTLLGLMWVTLALSSNEAAAGTPASQPVYGYDPRADFQTYNPQYRERRRKYSEQWEQLKDELVAQQRQGRKTPCSRQVLNEAKWLVYQTADFERAEKRLNDLRAMLAASRDPHDGSQLEADGSFGCCTSEWFLKLDYTIDELIALGLRWREPKCPVKLLERINSPDKLRAYMDSILIADVAKSGIDTRTELNHSSSALTRFILRSGTWSEIPAKFPLDEKLKAAWLDYLDHRWQDSQTGYWGTWYRTKDGLVKTCDLSITFHLVEFRKGQVKCWPQIIQTTLAIKDQRYPYGWMQDEQMSNHHNYDVVTLFHLGWLHATAEQKQRIRLEIRRMLDWCLQETLNEDGSFKLMDESTLGGAFYFSVAFLNEIGFFTKANRFWTEEEFPQAAQIRDRIKTKLKSLGLDDPEAQWALMMLEASR